MLSFFPLHKIKFEFAGKKSIYMSEACKQTNIIFLFVGVFFPRALFTDDEETAKVRMEIAGHKNCSLTVYTFKLATIRYKFTNVYLKIILNT